MFGSMTSMGEIKKAAAALRPKLTMKTRRQILVISIPWRIGRLPVLFHGPDGLSGFGMADEDKKAAYQEKTADDDDQPFIGYGRPQKVYHAPKGRINRFGDNAEAQPDRPFDSQQKAKGHDQTGQELSQQAAKKKSLHQEPQDGGGGNGQRTGQKIVKPQVHVEKIRGAWPKACRSFPGRN